MTAAPVLDFPARPEGRPSNAALSMEVRTLRHALSSVTEERDDLDAELVAYVSERVAVASETLALARRAMVSFAAGRSPAQSLVGIERLAIREQLRALSMRPSPDAA